LLYLGKGRVLPAPKLSYGQNETSSVVPRDGVWNMRNLKFIDARVMSHFGVINITRTDDRAINTFIGALTTAGRDMGMIHKIKLFVFQVYIQYFLFSNIYLYYRNEYGQFALYSTQHHERIGG